MAASRLATGHAGVAVTDFPYLHCEDCPDCGTRLVAVVQKVIGTPRATGGLIRMQWDNHFVWMQACRHVAKPASASRPE